MLCMKHILCLSRSTNTQAELMGGHTIQCGVQDCLPHVQVAASTFGAIARASSSGAGSLTLQLGLSVSSSNQVAALIQEHDPLGKPASQPVGPEG